MLKGMRHARVREQSNSSRSINQVTDQDRPGSFSLLTCVGRKNRPVIAPRFIRQIEDEGNNLPRCLLVRQSHDPLRTSLLQCSVIQRTNGSKCYGATLICHEHELKSRGHWYRHFVPVVRGQVPSQELKDHRTQSQPMLFLIVECGEKSRSSDEQ